MLVIDIDVDEIVDHDPYEVTSQLTSNQQRQRQRQRQRQIQRQRQRQEEKYW